MAIAPIPDIGVLQYAQVRFDALYSSTMSGTVEWDRAKRAVKYVTWRLEVTGIVASAIGGPIDLRMLDMRQQLTSPGEQLIYFGKGFGGQGQGADGGLIVNGPGKVQDVSWGPKPKLLNFTPLGNSISAMVSWEVEFTIPECPTAGFTNTMLAFNWGAKISYDNKSMATFHVEGEYEIALNYNSFDKVDNYRYLSEPPLPVGFTCVDRQFGYSDDKRTYSFSYTYKEMVYGGKPFGCAVAGGNYSVGSSANSKIMDGKWDANLSITYTMRQDWPRREAYLRFLGMWTTKIFPLKFGVKPTVAHPDPAVGTFAPQELILSGLQTTVFNQLTAEGRRQANLNLVSGQQRRDDILTNIQADAGVSKSMLIKSFKFNEGLHDDGDKITFDVSWTFTCSFASLLAASGIWWKCGDANGYLWQTTMANIQGATNWAQYYLPTDRDVVIDACSGIVATGAINNSGNPSAAMLGAALTGRFVDPDSGISPDVSIVFPGAMDAETSWLEYDNTFITTLDTGMALMKPLPQTVYPVDSLSVVDSLAAGAQQYVGNPINTQSRSGQSDYAFRARTSTYRVRIEGFGRRAGYQVPVPGLARWGGVVPVLEKAWVRGNAIETNYSGVPVYLNLWRLDYLIPVPPTCQQTPPANLSQGIGYVASPPQTIQVPVSVPEIAEAPLDTQPSNLKTGIAVR